MNFEEKIEKERNRIREELIEYGYANKSVGYTEFLEMYSPYKELVSEKEFAVILGMNSEAFKNIRIKGTKTIILKTIVTEQMKEEIIEKLRSQGYSNKMITYSEFLELYRNYQKYIAEKDFAKIIGITEGRYKNVKNRGGKTKILETSIDEESIEQEVKEKYGSISIDYDMFLSIYEPYKNQINSELKFAEIIGITHDSYNHMKTRKARARILKKDDIHSQLQEEIIEQIIKQGYEDKLVSYSEFLSLYNEYKDKLTEIQFAKILGISTIKHRNMKYYNNKTYVLKGKRELTDERKEEIRSELVSNGYANKNIKYYEFLQLYNNYKNEMEENQFAEILGLAYGNYTNMKYRSYAGGIILKTEQIADDIIKKVSDDDRIKEVQGSYINFSQFLDLFKPYINYMTEIQFAELIGISYNNYYNMKNNRVKVDNLHSIKMRIQHAFKESKVYSQEEIESFCKEYNITFDEFLNCIFRKIISDDFIEEKKDILREKGLFIGRKPIDKDILKKYGEEIIQFVHRQCEMRSGRYSKNGVADDVESDTLMYIIQKRGDVFCNYDEEMALEIIKAMACKYVKFSFISHRKIRKTSFEEGVTEKYIRKGEARRNESRRSKKTKIEDENVVKALKESGKDMYEQCINLLQYYFDIGLSNAKAIERTALDLNLDQVTMLEMMKKALLERKKVRKDADEVCY